MALLANGVCSSWRCGDAIPPSQTQRHTHRAGRWADEMVSRGGASLVQREPVFSRDGKRLLACTACTVTVFSVQTGEVLTVLRGHTGFVNSVVVVPVATVCHCWTAGLDGTLRFWDFAAGTLLRTVNVGHPVQSMVIPALCKPRDAEKGDAKRKALLVAWLSVGWFKGAEGEDENVKGRVICYNLTNGKQIKGHLAKTQHVETLTVSPGGGLVGMADDFKVWVWMVPHGAMESVNVIPWTILHHTKRIQVLAFDPSETRVAAGDHSGRILVWENVGDRTFSLFDKDGAMHVAKFAPPQHFVMGGRRGGGVRGKDDAAACATYHWHSSEVKSLTFTLDGVYLLSGGMEGVLVVWQLETGKRNFLPRIGGALLYIAPSLHPSLFAIACMDNSIKLLNIGTMAVERRIQGIKPSFEMPKNLTMTPMMVSVEPSEGKIVVATHNLSLQFYDAASDRHVTELQVTPRNYVTGGKEEEEGLPTCVTHVAFSADGACMATVDVRIAEHSIGGGACLKFWDRQPGNLRFAVNTQVEDEYEICGPSFNPRERMAVSCSDTEFKIWVPHERRGSRMSWRCRSVGSYRQRPVLAAAFSSDGSILAVAASEFLTLWNPATNSLVKVLSNSLVHHPQPIHHLAFVNQSNCLVAASSGDKPLLAVWDVSTFSVRWSEAIKVESLVVDPTRASFAALASVPSQEDVTNAVVALFDVASPAPLRYWNVRDGFGGTLLFTQTKAPEAAAAAAEDNKVTDLASPARSKLTFVTSQREFVVFDPYQEGEDEQPEQAVVRDAALPEEVSSAFTALYGKAAQPKKRDAPADVLSALSRAPWGTLLSGPSHVLPSLSVVCVPFMDSLLKKRTEQT